MSDIVAPPSIDTLTTQLGHRRSWLNAEITRLLALATDHESEVNRIDTLLGKPGKKRLVKAEAVTIVPKPELEPHTWRQEAYANILFESRTTSKGRRILKALAESSGYLSPEQISWRINGLSTSRQVRDVLFNYWRKGHLRRIKSRPQGGRLVYVYNLIIP